MRQIIRKRVRTLPRTTINHGPELLRTIDPAGTYRVRHRVALDNRIEGRVLRTVMLDLKTHGPKIVGLRTHLLRKLAHHVRTIAAQPRRTVRLLSPIIVPHRHLTTGLLLHQRTVIKRRLPKPGRLRPHGPSHDPLLLLKTSPGRRQDLPMSGSRSALRDPMSLVERTTTEKGTIKITKITKTTNTFGNQKAENELSLTRVRLFIFVNRLPPHFAVRNSGITLEKLSCRSGSCSSVC